MKGEEHGRQSPLGPVPSGWRLVRLKDVTTKIGSGATPKGGEGVYLPMRLKFALIRSQNVFDRHFESEGLAFICDNHAKELENAMVQPFDILLNITGDGVTFARTCLAPESVLPACVNQHVSIVRVDRTVADPGYVLSYLTHPAIKRYAESFNAGGSRRAITKGHIESFEVPLPPLSEQGAIARILGALDDKIKQNRRMNATLEAMARAIFKSWFVDFDPVHARAEGRQPYGMDAETAALFPDFFQDSSLGKIPKGWKVSKLGEVVEFAYGKALKEEDRCDGEVPVYGSNGQVGWHNEPLARGPGIVVGRKGNPGTVTWVDTDFYPIDTTFYVTLKGENRSMRYFFYCLSLLDLPSLGADSAVPGLNRNIAYMSDVLSPCSDVLEAFDHQCAPLMDRVHLNNKESRILAAMRDALLPKLISGEIRLKDAGQFMGRKC